MIVSQNFFTRKRNYLLALLLMLIITVVFGAFTINDDNDFDIARREIMLRRIGHELLLQSGDSISRVLPVKKITENEYEIRFEKEFSFQTDSLVNTTQRLLGKDPLTLDYVVKVLNCNNSSIAYGYAMSKNKKDDIISCIGRKQPKACYSVNIKFKPNGLTSITKKYNYFLGGLSLLAFIGFLFTTSNTPRRSSPKEDDKQVFSFGSVVFDVQKRQLIINDETVELTKTETRLLIIFASSPNEIIERNRLQKEIWEDDGVIVGRSLDMFISKLRKKLELDPNSQIIAIRSKGYKLEVSAS